MVDNENKVLDETVETEETVEATEATEVTETEEVAPAEEAPAEEATAEAAPALKDILFKTVNPIVGYAVFFGVLAVAIGLGLIICL